MTSETITEQNIEEYAKRIRSKILNTYEIRVYTKVLKLLKVFIEDPKEYLRLLPSSKNEVVKIAQDIITTLRNRNSIDELIEVWIKLDEKRRGIYEYAS